MNRCLSPIKVNSAFKCQRNLKTCLSVSLNRSPNAGRKGGFCHHLGKSHKSTLAIQRIFFVCGTLPTPLLKNLSRMFLHYSTPLTLIDHISHINNPQCNYTPPPSLPATPKISNICLVSQCPRLKEGTGKNWDEKEASKVRSGLRFTSKDKSQGDLGSASSPKHRLILVPAQAELRGISKL